jgi:hypothetical protein
MTKVTKPQPHKHQALMDAHKAGAEIEYLDHGEWCLKMHLDWYEECEYRIKPTPKAPLFIFAFCHPAQLGIRFSFGETDRHTEEVLVAKFEVIRCESMSDNHE